MGIIRKVTTMLGARGTENFAVSTKEDRPYYPTDIRVTCASNGYVVTVNSGNYDEREKHYVAANEEQLTETILLALVNRKIGQR